MDALQWLACGRFHNYFDSYFILINQIGVLGAFNKSAFVHFSAFFKEFTTQTRTSFIMLHLTY
jgi:hypothetical protein